MNKIFDFLKNVFVNIGIDEDDVKESALIKKDFGLDSTEMVDLVLSIKKEYGLSLDLSNELDFTVNDIVSKIHSNLEE